MADANGDLDLNYSGNFDALAMRFQLTNSTYFGLQRSIIKRNFVLVLPTTGTIMSREPIY